MPKINEDFDEDVDDEQVVEGNNILLARLYDVCASLEDRVEITTVTLEDNTEVIVILLKDARYSDEFGFADTI